jgi:hypothetical protein
MPVVAAVKSRRQFPGWSNIRIGAQTNEADMILARNILGVNEIDRLPPYLALERYLRWCSRSPDHADV